ncbi:MAG: M15 family metallopeptidase [Candidatus Cloacimonetes bacterium]|nr:M15 family metallopeptidase [Candidatus Cloacimonadota bacterium]
MIDISPYLKGVSEDCPQSVINELRLIKVEYLNFDQDVKSGYLLVHQTLAKDVQEIFKQLLNIKFLIQMVKPLSDPLFWDDDHWSDELSMQHNNTCSFNYRKINGKNKLSTHALGMAIDINPLQNPWVKDDHIIPSNASYDPKAKGTFFKDSLAVKIFEEKGFFWGGNFNELKDYHHFERKTKGYEHYFLEKRV